MDFREEYKQKLVSADEAVKLIKSGDWVDYGWCTNTVDALDQALAKRTDELFLHVRMQVSISAGTPGICPVSSAR